MEYIEKIKKMLCKELDEYAMKQKLTGGDLDMIWKLTVFTTPQGVVFYFKKIYKIFKKSIDK